MKVSENNKKKVFSVPEGYFEQLNRNIMTATVENSTATPRRKRFVLGKFARITGYAAAIVLFLGVAATILVPNKKADNATAQTMAIENIDNDNDNEYIDNIFNSYNIDEYTFYCYLTDTDSE